MTSRSVVCCFCWKRFQGTFSDAMVWIYRDGDRELTTRSIRCPNCGAPLNVLGHDMVGHDPKEFEDMEQILLSFD